MNRTILLVDPNLEVAAKIGSFLEEFGHITEIVPSKNEAMGAIKAFDPGLIVLAFNLPDSDGFGFISDLREIAKSLAPVIMIASEKQIEHYADRKSRNVPQAWIKRPVDQMELYNKVTEWHLTPVGSDMDAGKAAQKTKQKADPAKPEARQVEPQVVIDETDHPTPKTSQIGSLARVPIARLFYHLGRRELTGLMSLRHPPNHIDVHFDKGRVVNVGSNYIPELSLGMMLAKNMLITPQELAGARKRWERDGGMFGQVLVKMSLLEEAELERMLITQRVKKLVHLFSWGWRTGSYVFNRDPEQIQPIKGFILPFEHVVVAGIRTHYDMDRLKMVFDKRDRMALPAKVKTLAPERLASKSDVDALKKVIDAIRKSANLENAMLVSGVDELTFMQFAYALFVMDILIFD